MNAPSHPHSVEQDAFWREIGNGASITGAALLAGITPEQGAELFAAALAELDEEE